MLEKANCVGLMLKHVSDLGAEDNISLVLKAFDVLASLADVDMARFALEVGDRLQDLLARLVNQHREVSAARGEILHGVNDDLKGGCIDCIGDALEF